MDRQSEAYRGMTKEDIVEDIYGSVHRSAATSLKGIRLPEDFPDQGGEPKSLIMAEVVLHDRIMDPTAPDDHKVQGIYVSMAHRHGSEEE